MIAFKNFRLNIHGHRISIKHGVDLGGVKKESKGRSCGPISHILDLLIYCTVPLEEICP